MDDNGNRRVKDCKLMCLLSNLCILWQTYLWSRCLRTILERGEGILHEGESVKTSRTQPVKVLAIGLLIGRQRGDNLYRRCNLLGIDRGNSKRLWTIRVLRGGMYWKMLKPCEISLSRGHREESWRGTNDTQHL